MRKFIYLISMWTVAIPASQALAYEKAVEGKDVVLRKIYPKKRRVEVAAKGGWVLNSSYVNTILASGTISYFFDEEWGFNLEGSLAITSDKSERECVENFFNDPDFDVGPECGTEDDLAAARESSGKGDQFKANFGPAYPPIRELKTIITGNLLWNPIYGKQIILLSGVQHFDLFLATGGGIAMSDYYEKKTEFGDGTPMRGDFPVEGDTSVPTPGTDDPGIVGEAGRPEPVAQTNFLVHVAVGQRFHFAKRFMITAELKNYTLLGTESGFENFLALMGGFGVRF